MKKENYKNKASVRQFAKRGGFTLVEIMVATSIFMIIMLIAMGALITSSDVTKKSSALRTAMENVNFAMESMTRSLRTGTDYSCQLGSTINVPGNSVRDCLNGAHGIIFSSAHNAGSFDSGYALVDRGDGTKTVDHCDVTNGCQHLVSSYINVKNLTFYVKGSDTGDTTQPSVYITMNGAVSIKGVDTLFAIQTMVSQRSIE